MANHASTRTTQLYHRRRDDVSLDEVERQKNPGNPRARTWAHCVAKRCRPQI
jgi:hypothetical protein